MIFPVFRGLIHLALAPATWFLVAINVFVFAINLPQYAKSQKALEQFFDDTEFMRTQGTVYAQYIRESEGAHSAFLRQMSARALGGDQTSQMRMGGYALRDKEFIDGAMERQIRGDELALKQWRRDFIELRAVQAAHPTYKWGLSGFRSSWINWISYQFGHSGFSHLAWNMLFLVLFAGFLEVTAGSSFVVLVYIGGGICGAGLFTALAGLTASPLIGASGAVSAMMACIAILHWGEGVRFFYWLLPLPGYYGMRDLPAWLIVVAFLVPDLAGQIASVPDASGMAYSAHLGGAFFGALMGYAIRMGWLEKEEMPSVEETW